jgi:glycine betaine catabolism B
MISLSILDSQNSGKVENVTLQPEAMAASECSIGRSSACDLRLDSQEISRTHGKIVYTGAGCYSFCDLGSSGGSMLNGNILMSQQCCDLKVGDLLVLGRFSLTVMEIGDPDEQTVVKLPPERQPAEYMPVYKVAPEDFTHWKKGDITVRCAEIIDETATAKTFRFVADPQMLFSYKPGQYVTLNLEIDGEEVLRSYSISSTPSRPHSLEITVKRVPPERADLPAGLVSNWLHDNLQVGDEVKITGPLGKFTCWQHSSPKLLLISAGSGITPMMSMSRWICDTIAACDVIFLHSAKQPQDIIYHQELITLASRHQNFQPLITVTGWQSGQGWAGLRGRISAPLLKSMVPDLMERRIFVCGPAPFMEATKAIAQKLGFPMEQYHEESFGGGKKFQQPALTPDPSAGSGASGSNGSGSGGAGGTLRQMLKGGMAAVKSAPLAKGKGVAAKMAKAPTGGISVTFQKSDRQASSDGSLSILEIAEETGVKIRSSCRAGSCGTCKKKKLSGNVKMADFDEEALEAAELAEGYILTCVAFPTAAVVIDA